MGQVSKTSSAQQLAEFTQSFDIISQATDGHVLFVMDATGSRESAWDLAVQTQADMFTAVARQTSLSIKLGFYRGYDSFQVSPWVKDPETLKRLMSSVRCQPGRTQIHRVLKRALTEHQKQPINSLVFVGDSIEEPIDQLADLAGQMRLHGIPGFFFYEGLDPAAIAGFKQLAKISGGVAARFDTASPDRLLALLRAAARFATAGLDGLRALPNTPKEFIQQLEQF